MTRVVDASLVVAALVDSGPAGRWADAYLEGEALAAPHLMPVEVTNILRRAIRNGDLSQEVGSLAFAALLALRVELFPYEPFAERVWGLRDDLTAYDAWYVAIAESLGVELGTLDAHLGRAPGLRCRIATPPGG